MRVRIAPYRRRCLSPYLPFAALAIRHLEGGAFAVGATPAMYSRRISGTGSAP
jgi:hypothetical protein